MRLGGVLGAWMRNYVIAPRYRAGVDGYVTTSDGVRLHTVTLAGPPTSGVTVLIAPGFGHWHRHSKLVEFASAMAAHANVVVLELRGHGHSGGASTLGSVESADVAAAVAAVPAGQALVLVGVSLGAAASVVYCGTAAERGLRVPDAVVSISGPGWWTPERPRQGVARLLRAASSGITRGGMRLFMRVRLVDVAGLGWCDPIDVVANIAPAPLLLVHDPDDWYFGADQVEALAARAGTTATVWWRPGHGHASDLFDGELYRRIAADVIGPIAAQATDRAGSATPSRRSPGASSKSPS
ncbi:MAG TPA: alpha/beta fold hydrolase [Acidimicrobiales bacterium]|nr:alpha/beta fold hydrolase [Acidimicrobiales bacterium]